MDMGEDAEFELRILVKALTRIGVVRAKMRGDEVVIHQHLLQKVANLRAPGRARFRLQQVMAFMAKFLDRHTHRASLLAACPDYVGEYNRNALPVK